MFMMFAKEPISLIKRIPVRILLGCPFDSGILIDLVPRLWLWSWLIIHGFCWVVLGLHFYRDSFRILIAPFMTKAKTMAPTRRSGQRDSRE